MKVRLLHTNGNGWFEETAWDKPEPTEDEIEVKAVMTGVCRSDIAMMQGEFGPLPLHMQGHEGLGIVTKVGKNIKECNVGDYVATRGEPAYADYYNTKIGEFVIVPELSPQYILEPVACGINCVRQAYDEVHKRSYGKILIIGTGFLAGVIYNQLNYYFGNVDIDVFGHHNKNLFGNNLITDLTGKTYDIVFDLGSGTQVFDQPILNNEALVVLGVEKAVQTNFQNLLWKACTIVFPSPRSRNFHNSMVIAGLLIKSGKLDVSSYWTKGYNRDTEWMQAFEDGVNRPENYNRGYIKWD